MTVSWLRQKRKDRLKDLWFTYCFHCGEKFRPQDKKVYCTRTGCDLVFHVNCFHGKAYFVYERNRNVLNIRDTRWATDIDFVQGHHDKRQICRYCLLLICSFFGLMEKANGNIRLKYLEYHPSEILEIIANRVLDALEGDQEFSQSILLSFRSMLQRIFSAQNIDFLFWNSIPIDTTRRVVKLATEFGYSNYTLFTYPYFFQNINKFYTMEQLYFALKLNQHQKKILYDLRLVSTLDYRIAKFVYNTVSMSCNTLRECVDCFCLAWYDHTFTKNCTRPHGLVWAPINIDGQYHWWVGKVYTTSVMPNYDYSDKRRLHVVFFHDSNKRFSLPFEKFPMKETDLFTYAKKKPRVSLVNGKMVVPIENPRVNEDFQLALQAVELYVQDYHKNWGTEEYKVPKKPDKFKTVEHVFLPSHYVG